MQHYHKHGTFWYISLSTQAGLRTLLVAFKKQLEVELGGDL